MGSDTSIIVKPVELEEELRLANDLMAKSHNQDYFSTLNWMETCGAGYPGFRRDHTRIATSNGDMAGSLRLHTDTIRVGEARLKMGGIAWVSTSQRHRHKGVARKLISDTMRYMQDHQYHMAMLFGIPNFYHRFGFVTTLAEYSITVNTDESLHAGPVSTKARAAKPGDIKTLQRIHNNGDSGVACSLLRTAAHITNKWDRWKGAQVLINSKGKVEGYFLAHRTNTSLSVTDLGVANPSLCPALLAHCGEAAQHETVSQIRFYVPPPHPFAHYLLLHESTHEMKIVREQGGMMAFVNLAECLEHMIPEWENRLLFSAAREKRTEVTLVLQGKCYRIRANRGALDVAPVSGMNKLSLTTEELMHLVTGYRYLEDILLARRRMINSEGRALLSVMFPKRTPYVWPVDRF